MMRKKGGGQVVEGEPDGDEPKKKPGLALVISMGKGKHDEPDGDEGELPEEFSAAFDEFIDALKNDDAEGAKQAFYAAIHSCK